MKVKNTLVCNFFLKVFSDMFSKRTSSLISVHFFGGKMGAAFAKESSGRPSRAESGRLGKLGSVLLGSARFGIFMEYRAEPYNNHFQIIVAARSAITIL